jgi:signal transduction histidine kinase/DNA-binding response OmpR family regulator
LVRGEAVAHPRLQADPAEVTVLVIDDEEVVRETTGEILLKAGFVVRHASTGAEGLRLAAEQPQLVVLDIDLPDLDGFEVCRRLKSDPATAGIPVLHLSGIYLDLEDKLRGLSTGADAYLTRPVKATELVATVKALLRLRHAETRLRFSEARRRDAEVLAEVTRIITQSLDVEEVADRIVHAVRELLQVPMVGLFRVDPESGDLVGLAVSGDAARHFPTPLVFPRGSGLLGLALHDRLPVYSADLLRDEHLILTAELRAALDASPYRAAVAIPLLVKDRPVGGLLMAGPGGWRLDEVDLRIAGVFADQAAIALENARLFEEAERGRREAEETARLERALAESLDLETLAKGIVESVVGLIDVPAVLLMLEQPDGSLLALARGGGVGAELEAGWVLAPGTGLASRLVAEGRVLAVADAPNDPALGLPDDVRRRLSQCGVRSLVAVPVRIKGGVTAVLLAADRLGRRFTRREITLLEMAADRAALALENARLLAETRVRLKETETLLAVGQALSLDLPTEEAMRRVARETALAFGADTVGAYFRDARHAVLRPLAGYRVPSELLQRLQETPFPIEKYAAIREAWETGRPVWSPDVMADRRWFTAALLPSSPSHAVLFAPTKARGEIVGGLFLVWWRPGHRPTEADLRLIEGIAAQVGLALERKRAQDEQARLETGLREAQKMDAIGRLAGGIAHDFNNLLTVITGRGELLRDLLRPDDPMLRHVDLIQKTGQRATHLIRQLLAFSRKQVLQPRVLDLNAIVRGMDKMLRRLIREDIDLAILADAALGRVKADPTQIEQVILNLVVNARDAMPEGGRLVIETANMHLDRDALDGVPAGNYAMLSVGDTGIGMDAETQTHLFEPFFTTKGPGKGTGLGLATVYGIVRQSGGHIVVESDVGRGSTFRIYLPRAEETADPPEPPSGAGTTPRGQETVLLVEDHDEMRDLAREILARLGYTVIDARHPGEALLIAERRDSRIHLLVTDVVMPEMNGRELAERLTAIRPDLRVVYISGYPDDAIGEHGVLQPGTVLLQKPFTPDALGRKVREVLDARR